MSNRLVNSQIGRQSLWQTVPTAGLTMAERTWLKDSATWIVGIFEEPLIVNIGIFRGASAHCLRAGAPRAKLVGIDLRPETAVAHLQKLDMEYLRGDSHDYCSDFIRPIRFLFIDSATRYPSVKQVVTDWVPKVVEGGLFAIACYSLPPPRWGVKQAVDEWLNDQPLGKWQEIDAPDSLKAFRRTKTND